MNKYNVNETLVKYEIDIRKMTKSLYVKSTVRFFWEYDDVLQNCYLAIIDKLKYYDDTKKTLSAFLFMVIKNQINEIIRLNESKKRTSDNPYKNLSIDFYRDNEECESNKSDKNSLMVEKENKNNDVDMMVSILDSLDTELEKDIIIMLYEGYTLNDIIELKNINKQKLYRIRMKIKDKLESELKKGSF